MSRAIYTLTWWLALPLLPLRLWWRGRREPGYRERIGERFGRYAARRPDGTVIWIHAVSVGETRAAAPLIELLRNEHPEASILLTHMTATGRATGAALYGDKVTQAWLPYDIPFAVRAFLGWARPAIGLLMETELWPNLLSAAHRSGIPILLVNARLSERSARGYARVATLARELLGHLSGIAAQSPPDAERLVQLGARDAIVTGNLKFDIEAPLALLERGHTMRARLGATRPVLLAASTREGEEELLLDALARHPDALPADALVVLVPRHPQRFEEVAQMLSTRNERFVRRSADVPVGPDVRFVLGDSMGEMFAYYAASDVAFVGGSLVPTGGQNLLEPIAVGVPVLIGPHTFNFADVASQAIDAGAALRIVDADQLLGDAATLLRDPARRAAMKQAGQRFMASHRGATQRLWAWLQPRIEERLRVP
ncbi:MAG TPA: lipid IV(A) 3-deoxy-D-manno-octulosonic acid transferase [Casimicrobiaceae bacterium]|nr:lipid IV(A) 3-deoxy-D-manno-octulosonic acid transferase [Casimicrobiaceae bacterium]